MRLLLDLCLASFVLVGAWCWWTEVVAAHSERTR